LLARASRRAGAVDSLADRGVEFIKSCEMLRREVFLAVLDEARRRGRPAAEHLPLTVDASEASDRGLRSFQHLRNIDFACSAAADSPRGPCGDAGGERGVRPCRERADRRVKRRLRRG
jgi:hypothetical protein